MTHTTTTRLIFSMHVAVTLAVFGAALWTADGRFFVAFLLCCVLWALELI